jgi:hypothetical protein
MGCSPDQRQKYQISTESDGTKGLGFNPLRKVEPNEGFVTVDVCLSEALAHLQPGQLVEVTSS